MCTFVFPEATKCQTNRKVFIWVYYFEQKECVMFKQEKKTIHSDWEAWERPQGTNVTGLEEGVPL